MQYDPARIAHLVELHNDGFGCADSDRIRIEGIEPSSVRARFGNRHGGTAFYDDVVAPEVSIDACAIEGDVLLLSLGVDEDAAKVEVLVDGKRLDGIVVDGFDHLRLPLPNVTSGLRTVTVRAYDRYLNLSVQEIEVLSSP